MNINNALAEQEISPVFQGEKYAGSLIACNDILCSCQSLEMIFRRESDKKELVLAADFETRQLSADSEETQSFLSDYKKGLGENFWENLYSQFYFMKMHYASKANDWSRLLIPANLLRMKTKIDLRDVLPWFYGFSFSFKDKWYIANSQYCCNPGCSCKDVTVIVEEGRIVDSDRPLTCFNYDYMSGRITDEEGHRIKLGSESDKVFSYLLNDMRMGENFPATHNIMKSACERTREILAKEVLPATVSVPAAAGRNDPCPCGSGKKYKKCCLQ